MNPADPDDAVVSKGFAGGRLVGWGFLLMRLLVAGVGGAVAGWW